MATFNVTISNSLTVFSPTPSSKYGDAVWGTDLWGEGKDFDLIILKWLSEAMTLTDVWSKQMIRKVSNTITVTGDADLGPLSSGIWDYTLTGGATDPDDRVFPTYTEDTKEENTYTEDTENDPDWSES